ncbi:hypothetical protein INT45_007568 [Circinella minor]|uniref:Reverse transcriptase domain-containing protein n=1 Tax=Circinella minor TaxID=1195481 RepID=A0A8H7S5I9_9FUNG|nr:hypothetical protein INT45_007568 [Circinella minor]
MPEEQHEQTSTFMDQIIATLEQLSTRLNNIEASSSNNHHQSSLPMDTSDNHVPDFEGTDDEFLTEQAPTTLLQPYPALVEAIPGMAKDFFVKLWTRTPDVVFYMNLDRQLRLVQYRLSGITRPIDLFAHDTIQGHQVDGPTTLRFANTIYMLLSDVASLITNICTEFVCKETGLSSSPITAPGHLPNSPLLDTSQVLEQTKLTQALRKLSRRNHTTRWQNGGSNKNRYNNNMEKSCYNNNTSDDTSYDQRRYSSVQSPKQLFQGTVGGCLSSFSSAWTSLSSLSWIRHSIKDGFSIPFRTAPPTFQHHQHRLIHQIPTSTSTHQLINKEISLLLKKNAIEEATSENGFLSTLFTIPKKTGDLRPVLNLQPLNQYIPKRPFKVETMQQVCHMIQQGDWLTSIDLQDAFLHILVHKQLCCYLRFRWNNKIYQFRTLCFGMSLSPMVFTKILRPVLRWARRQGIRISASLDDLILADKTKEQAHHYTQKVLSKCFSLGFLVKSSKSHLSPTQSLDHLGFHIKTTSMRLSVPPKKLRDLRREARKILNQSTTTLRHLSSFIGKAQATTLAVFPARLYT